MVITTTIKPGEVATVAAMKLMKNYKLKSKFKFVMKNPPIADQERYLEKDISALISNIGEAI